MLVSAVGEYVELTTTTRRDDEGMMLLGALCGGRGGGGEGKGPPTNAYTERCSIYYG